MSRRESYNTLKAKKILFFTILICLLISFCFLTACADISESGGVIGLGYYSQIDGKADKYFVMIETDVGKELLVWLPVDNALLERLKVAIENGEDIYIECKKRGNNWVFSEVICIGC